MKSKKKGCIIKKSVKKPLSYGIVRDRRDCSPASVAL